MEKLTFVVLQWTLVYTKYQQESIAKYNLERQGFVVYFPMVTKRVSHARSVALDIRPLFPRYLFVKIATETACWRPILSTTGVQELIRSGDKPVAANRVVSALKELENTSPSKGGQQDTDLKQNLDAMQRMLESDALPDALKQALIFSLRTRQS